MSNKYVLAGLTDIVTTCECCGKSNLKRTVVLSLLNSEGEHSEYQFFGSQCAARALRWKLGESDKKIQQKASDTLEKAVSDRCHEILSNKIEFQEIKGVFWLRETLQQFLDTQNLPSHDQILQDREKAYPILGYLSGKIDAISAAKHLYF